MLPRYRCLVAIALFAAVLALPAQAQRGGGAMRRLPYTYFRYRVPRENLRLGPDFRMRDDIRLRALERSRERLDRVRERQFMLQDRLRDRRFELQDRAWRKQLENQDRAMTRMRERLDRLPRMRPFMFRGHSRTI